MPDRNIVTWLGSKATSGWGAWQRVVAIVATTLVLAVQPRYWTRPVRNVFARQVLFTGVEAFWFVSLIALIVGVSIVVQLQFWLGAVGQTELLGPILVTVVVREVGPLLTNFVVIGRSGAAIASEMATMQAAGEINLLDAQGLDPQVYLLMPRLLGMAASVFCLTIVFIVVCFSSGYLSGMFIGVGVSDPVVFLDSVLMAVKPADVVNVLVKTIVPGLLTGAVCCDQGFCVAGALTEVPQATTRGIVRSVGGLFITSILVSLVTYL